MVALIFKPFITEWLKSVSDQLLTLKMLIITTVQLPIFMLIRSPKKFLLQEISFDAVPGLVCLFCCDVCCVFQVPVFLRER